MAVKKVIEIDVDVLNAQGGLDKFVDTLKETEKQSTSLKTELRKLKEQLATLPEGTAEYDKIAKKAGEVSDKLTDINTKVKNLGSDTKGIDAVVQGAQTLSGAFSVASSASALLGDENEDLQKTMLKVESAIALTVGIQSIANALQKESALVLGIQSVATKAQILLQTAYTAVVGTSTGALKALKVALISTGIGAFVVLLGSLIASMSSSTDATDELTDAQKRLNNALEDGKKLNEDFVKRNDYNTQIALANARKRGAGERELLAIELDGIEKRAKANQQESKDILATQDQFYNLTKEQQERVRALKAENEELERQGKIKIANFDADMAEKERERQKKAIEDNKKSEEEKLKDRQDARKKELDAINEQAKVIEENSKKLAEEKLKKDIELKKKADEILKQIEIELAPEETPTQKLQREYEERRAILIEAGESTLALESKFVTDKLALRQFEIDEEEKFKLKLIESEENVKNAKKNALNESLNILQDFAGKNKGIALAILAVQKGLAIAEVISNASKGIAVSQANLSAVPVILPGGIPNPTYPLALGSHIKNVASTKISAATSIATILAQGIQSAKSTLSSGGGGGASAGGGGGSAPSSAPQFNVVGNAGINQIASTMNKEQVPVQAFVVGNKVTSQQALDRNIVDNASL